MTELIEEVKVGASSTQTVEYLVYYLLGALEVLLAFRLLFKLAGASVASGFVQAIYSVSSIFVWPFEGIFRRAVVQGSGVTSVFEPATITAILVYAVIGWGIVKLVRISSGEKQV